MRNPNRVAGPLTAFRVHLRLNVSEVPVPILIDLAVVTVSFLISIPNSVIVSNLVNVGFSKVTRSVRFSLLRIRFYNISIAVLNNIQEVPGPELTVLSDLIVIPVLVNEGVIFPLRSLEDLFKGCVVVVSILVDVGIVLPKCHPRRKDEGESEHACDLKELSHGFECDYVRENETA